MMDKAKAYDEALEKARQDRDAYQKELDKTDKNSQLASILRAGISALEMVFPQLKESDDERVRKDIIDHFELIKAGALYDNQEESDNIISSCNEKIAYLEKQKENIEKEYVFRPLAGTDINTAILQAIRRANEGEHLVLAFNGAYIPVRKGCNANKIVDIYDAFIEKQKEQKVDIDKLRRDLYQSGYNDGYQHGKEDTQKEQESIPNTYGCLNCTKWEECEKGLTPCSGHRLKIVDQKPTDDKAFEEWIDSWFKEHKEKAYPQITMDEKEFKNFCRGIRNMYQQKSDWNEEDEEIWFALITFFKTYLQKYPPACKDEKIQANRILKWLNTTIKSFRLRYRWKPSKEKMDALKNVAYGTYQNGDGPALRELYEQLLKLGVKEEPEYY